MSNGDFVLLAGFVEGSGDTLAVDYFQKVVSAVRSEPWPVEAPVAARLPNVGIGVLLEIAPVSLASNSEMANLWAAERLLSLLAEATRAGGAVVAVEYGGEVIGWIRDGKLDDALTAGFLGEWRQRLGT